MRLRNFLSIVAFLSDREIDELQATIGECREARELFQAVVVEEEQVD